MVIDERSDQSHLVLNVERSLSGRAWRPRILDTSLLERYASVDGVSELLARVLAGRGVSPDDVAAYFQPTLKSGLADPSLITDMDAAVERVCAAIENSEKILIFGDYDVDGATSSALLKRYLTEIGVEASVYIPDRLTEGYGPSVPAFEKFVEDQIDLIITLDCGTVAFDPIEAAAQGGIDVIVIDHHQPPASLPKAFAIINPHRTDDQSNADNLSAGGLSFMFLVGLNRALRTAGYFQKTGRTEPDLRKNLDLVALSTVCDVMPLRGLNRIFVAQGLRMLAQTENMGLSSLRRVAGAKGAPTTYDLGFILGPRINAGGRIGRSDLGSRLLSTRDPQEAEQLAWSLHELNEQRRSMERQVLERAIEGAERQLEEAPDTRILVVSETGWHPGIVGIVASRIVERFHLPALVIGIDEAGVGKGSGRSVQNLDLGGLIARALEAGLLRAGGGHAMAVGVTIDEAQLQAFSHFLQETATDLQMEPGTPVLKLDGTVHPSAVSRGVYNDIQRAAPFGEGNPEPRFALEAVTVSYADQVGDGHIRCTLKETSSGRGIPSIAFRVAGGPVGEALLNRQLPIHVAGKMRPDAWRGGEAMQFQIEDAALAE